MCNFKTHSITKTNELFYTGAVVVTNRLGGKINKAAEKKEPIWRRRLQIKMKELGKDLRQLESSKDKEVSNVRHWQIERKYSIRVKTLGGVIEELKQKIVAIAAKVRRYQERVDSFRQNRMFQNIQRQFYRELNQEGERCDDDDQPDADESKKFWGDIWSESVDHNRDAKWLKDLQTEVSVTKQKTGEGRCNQGKFEEDSWQNAKLEVTRSRLSPGVLVKEF